VLVLKADDMRAPVTKDHALGTVGFVADRAIDCLHSGTGFSLVRIGDGEGRLLAYPDAISRQMMNRHLCFWFGRADFDDTTVLALRAILTQTIDAADVIGVHVCSTLPCNKNQWWHVAEQYLKAIGRWYPEGLCELDTHRALWRKGEIDRIAAECKRIVVVTCRDIPKLAVHFSDKPVYRVEVPGEGNMTRKPTDHWQRFNEIEAHVARLSEPGVLVLVGAGVLGKAYATTAAQAGAVALDIGSVFDGWAQVESRSYLMGRLGEYRL